MHLPSKPCVRCGRSITWRKKWARDWEHVRYCSDACRRQGAPKVDDDDDNSDGDKALSLEGAILALLNARAAGATICPSEAARAVAGDDEGQWRPWMEPARQAARRLVAAGRIDIMQKGHVVDGDTARGPIRLRRRPPRA